MWFICVAAEMTRRKFLVLVVVLVLGFSSRTSTFLPEGISEWKPLPHGYALRSVFTFP